MLAAEKGNSDIMDRLLKQNLAKINARDNKGKTALFYAVDCDIGENMDIVL